MGYVDLRGTGEGGATGVVVGRTEGGGAGSRQRFIGDTGTMLSRYCTNTPGITCTCN